MSIMTYEDLRYSDEEVWSRDNPYVDVDEPGAIVFIETRRGLIVVAW